MDINKVKLARKDYCQVHMDEWMVKLEVNDWFEYLDQSDRLVQILERAKPFNISAMSHEEYDEKFICWGDLEELIITNWYGLWLNLTPKELKVAEAVTQLHHEWHRSGGFHSDITAEKEELMSRYDELVSSYIDL